MSPADWIVIILLLLVSLALGLWFSKRSGNAGMVGYFAAGRKLPWWAIGLSNTATYQSGAGGFIMLILTFGLVGNWLWWTSWIIWMPLVALIWAPMWRRMKITTTAELITLRYGGKPAQIARKFYAAMSCFGFAVLLMGYITGFFVKTLAPIIEVSEFQVLLVLGGVTVLYSMFGGLSGVVYVDVLQFVFLILGSFLFLTFALPQAGGLEEVISKIQHAQPEALKTVPPAATFPLPLFLILIVQGFFFAGSPTAGEGSTAQRFMAARSDREAMKGQLFNTFLALSLRMIPLIGIGLIALSMFTLGGNDAASVTDHRQLLDDPVHAWGMVVNMTRLPAGLKGLLVAIEVAAYLSTLSTLINWGSSFVVNDLLPKKILRTNHNQLIVSRLTTLFLFLAAGLVSVLFVDDMVSWFLFINSAMVIFLLPLSWFRFFWWRFNVWGELAAIVLGLPLSIWIWFIMDYQHKSLWQGLAILFGISFMVLIITALVTPPEKKETLELFYERCRPPGWWRPVKNRKNGEESPVTMPNQILTKSFLGIGSSLGLVLLTNTLFTGPLWLMIIGGLAALVLGILLIRLLNPSTSKQLNN